MSSTMMGMLRRGFRCRLGNGSSNSVKVDSNCGRSDTVSSTGSSAKGCTLTPWVGRARKLNPARDVDDGALGSTPVAVRSRPNVGRLALEGMTTSCSVRGDRVEGVGNKSNA